VDASAIENYDTRSHTISMILDWYFTNVKDNTSRTTLQGAEFRARRPAVVSSSSDEPQKPEELARVVKKKRV
jgi:hypothetical protein